MPETDEAMKQAFGQLIAYLRQAIEFGKEQMPGVAHELIARAMYTNGMWLGFWCAVVMLCFAAAMRCYRNHLEATAEWEKDTYRNYWSTGMVVWGWGCVLAGVGTVVSVIIMVAQAVELGSIYIAPKVYLLEWLRHALPG